MVSTLSIFTLWPMSTFNLVEEDTLLTQVPQLYNRLNVMMENAAWYFQIHTILRMARK